MGMPRPDVSEERINQILDAAIAVFAREGFAQARMDDIAHEARLSKGALYIYFKSKDAIISAIMQMFFRQEIRSLPAYDLSNGTVSEYLITITHLLTGAVERMTPLLPVGFEFYAIAGRRRDVRQFLQEYFAEYRQKLVAAIQQGVARGEFHKIDPEMVAITIIALFEGLVLLWMVDPQTVQWGNQAEQALHLLLDGMRRQG
jgi:AcrR family transcriptional regulator